MEGKNELRFWLAIRELPSAQFVSLADYRFNLVIDLMEETMWLTASIAMMTSTSRALTSKGRRGIFSLSSSPSARYKSV